MRSRRGASLKCRHRGLHCHRRLFLNQRDLGFVSRLHSLMKGMYKYLNHALCRRVEPMSTRERHCRRRLPAALSLTFLGLQLNDWLRLLTLLTRQRCELQLLCGSETLRRLVCFHKARDRSRTYLFKICALVLDLHARNRRKI